MDDLQEDSGVNDSRVIKNKVTLFEREKLSKNYSKYGAIGRSPSVSKATKNIQSSYTMIKDKRSLRSTQKALRLPNM